ncbi:MAG: hypothetical protein M1827_007669 [Pycnora praestabilis]|nr:MAG: hypothetical protein M1827_007669 [Pycnora praestabilis]
MFFTLSLSAKALLLLSFSGSALADSFRFSGRAHVNPFGNLVDRQLVCNDDPTLIGLRNQSAAAQPFCGTFLGLPTATAYGYMSFTPTVTASTTISVTFTNSVRAFAQATETDAVTIVTDVPKRKRQDMTMTQDPTGETPSAIASLVSTASGNTLNSADAALISSVSSACSCLPVTEETVTVSPTASPVTVTNTVEVEFIVTDTITQTFTNTITSGTIVVTSHTSTNAASSFSSAISTPSFANSTLSTPSSAVSNATIPLPTGSINATLSASPTTSVNITAIIASMNLTSTSTSLPASATVTPIPDGCPAGNGTIIVTAYNEEFELECGINYPTNELIGIYRPSLLSCIDLCAESNNGLSFTECQGVSFIPDAGNANCYLISSTAYPTANSSVDSAILYFGLPPISSNSSSPPTTATSNSSAPPYPTASINSTIYTFSIPLSTGSSSSTNVTTSTPFPTSVSNSTIAFNSSATSFNASSTAFNSSVPTTTSFSNTTTEGRVGSSTSATECATAINITSTSILEITSVVTSTITSIVEVATTPTPIHRYRFFG